MQDIHKTKCYSPLIHAIRGRNLDIARLLIEKGANINHYDEKSEESPLSVAVSQGSTDIVKMLVEKSVSLNPNNVKMAHPILEAVKLDKFSCLPGESREDFAQRKNEARFEMVKLLAESGSDFHFARETQRTPLAECCKLETGGIEIAKFLLKLGANVHGNFSTENPILCAVASNNIDAAIILIQHGADLFNIPNEKAHYKPMPLVQYALDKAAFKTCAILIDSGCVITRDYNTMIKKYQKHLSDAFEDQEEERRSEGDTEQVKSLEESWVVNSYSSFMFKDKRDRIAIKRLETIFSEVRPLKWHMRSMLRRQLGLFSPCDVQKLPLPKSLQDYLLCHDLAA